MLKYRTVTVAVIGVLAVVLLSAIFLSRQSGKVDDHSPLIGAALPLTGNSASWGEKARDAIVMAVDQSNAANQAGAPKIAVKFEDSKGDAAGGSSAIRALLDSASPVAAIGGITSGETAAMIPLVTARKVTLVSPTASANSLSGASPFFFRLWPADAFETQAFAKYLAQNGVTEIAVLYIQNEYGTGVKDTFNVVFPQAGGKILAVEGYSPDETNFRPILDRVARAGARNVYIAGYYKDAGLILTQAKDLKTDQAFFGTTTVGDMQIVKLAGAAANGLVFSELMSFDPGKADSEMARKFVADFKQRFGREPGWAEAHGYDSALIILDAVGHGARTGDQIRAYLSSNSVAGVTGTVKFDSKGDIQGRRIAIKKIENGVATIVKVVGD
ncbi:MAG: branched-chain amino acid transport system substrate-binding protein [Bradyrhizobium sp.]|jgi:branched-chain amino acid transport system substrate-binding protein|nr:branched-chain amino acid transport system substrate-binding protein [Bradyrhizobium sp.]